MMYSKTGLMILGFLAGTNGLLLTLGRVFGEDESRMTLEAGSSIVFALCIGFVAVINAIEKQNK